MAGAAVTSNNDNYPNYVEEDEIEESIKEDINESHGNNN